MRRGSTKKPSGRKPITLTGEETLELARLHRGGKSLRAISRVLRVKFGRRISPATLCRLLRVAHCDQRDFRAMMQTLRAEAFDAWRTAMHEGAKRGRSAPAEALLAATGDVEQKKPQGDRLIIVVGDGSKPIGELPAIPKEFLEQEQAALPTVDARGQRPTGPIIIDAQSVDDDELRPER